MPEGYRLAKYISPSRNSKRGIISTAGYILTLSGAKKTAEQGLPHSDAIRLSGQAG